MITQHRQDDRDEFLNVDRIMLQELRVSVTSVGRLFQTAAEELEGRTSGKDRNENTMGISLQEEKRNEDIHRAVSVANNTVGCVGRTKTGREYLHQMHNGGCSAMAPQSWMPYRRWR